MPGSSVKRVRIVEVGPRDGLQNEPVTLPTADKLEFIRRLVAAGCQDIEVASFVRPDRVPQMADAAEVVTSLFTENLPARFIALVPNEKGLERALTAGAKAVAVFTAASETFNQKNIGRGITESLVDFRPLIATAKTSGLWVRGYISTAFVCPYEGIITPEKVVKVATALQEMGVDEVSIGDTIGQAEPDAVAQLTERLQATLLDLSLAYHFHDTGGKALSNIARALEFGVDSYDSSASGLGGCPFAPRAPGNVATEQLIHFLGMQGIETNLNAQAVAGAGQWVRERMVGEEARTKRKD